MSESNVQSATEASGMEFDELRERVNDEEFLLDVKIRKLGAEGRKAEAECALFLAQSQSLHENRVYEFDLLRAQVRAAEAKATLWGSVNKLIAALCKEEAIDRFIEKVAERAAAKAG